MYAIRSYYVLEFQPRAKSITLVKDVDASLNLIQGGANQLRQVFLNVILNAVQAMPDGGALTVST